MWKVGITLLVTLIMAAALLGACSGRPEADDGEAAEAAVSAGEAVSAAAADEESETAAAASAGPIVVDARVVPAEAADLSLPTAGIVSEVLVEEGDRVVAGQPLVRQNTAQLRTGVSRAEAELRRSQARLAQLQAGARTQEIDAARAALAATEAQLLRLVQGSLPGEIAQAEAGVASAQASLQAVLDGASEEQIIAARADLQNAEAERTRAQRAYDQIKWRNDAGATPEAAQLQVATNNFEAAAARLADLERGPADADVARARAEVRRVRAQLDTLRSTLPTDVAAAEAAVQQAQAQLDLLLAGSRPEEIASAEADVAAATAALQQALVLLAEAELRAPFDGTVAQVNVNAGEQVTPGDVVLRLAKLGDWEIRTEDLTELDIVNVRAGDPVALSFDAIPDLELPGVVERIRPIGADQRGDIVYTVVVKPQTTDERLLWNMTAVAAFGEE